MPEPSFFLDHPAITFTDSGELVLAGVRAGELAQRFGTPLVVLLEDVIRTNCRRYQSRLAHYPRSRIYYASKAFLSIGFCRLLMQEGLGLDAVSAGELYTALASGFPPEQIAFHGNAKTLEELQLALDCGVGRIIVDNFEDIHRLNYLLHLEDGGARGKTRDEPVKLLLRIAPGIKPDTHEYIQTGQVDSKFGFNLFSESGDTADSDAYIASRRLAALAGTQTVGLHCHIGSQIMDDAAFIAAARVMLQFYARLKHELGLPLDELNIGGGIGIRYQPGDQPPSIEDHLERLGSTLLTLSDELGVEPPVLCDEPGRSIVGEAGVTLYTVQSVKRIPGVRNYAGLDGGMTDNPRYALYGARHYALRASAVQPSRAGNPEPAEPELWSLSGKCCETGDMLIHDAPMPPLEPGDVVAMFSTGAYTFSMASNYNRVPRPAVVLAGSRGVDLLSRRETPEDMARLDMIPEWLSTDCTGANT